MYYFIQNNAEGKDAWQMVAADKQLTTVPSFRTVLQVSADPDVFMQQGVEPSDRVKYFGPMYFDLDGDAENIEDVLEESKVLYQELVSTEGIDAGAISIYLSGGRGVHFTINPRVFGITRPTVALPHFWRLYASKFFDMFQYIDTSVYSLGRGRMWRTTQVQRPNGKWKVQITAEDLMSIDADRYAELVSTQRQEFFSSLEVSPNPQLVSFMDAAEPKVKAILKGLTSVENQSERVEALKEVEGVPGCIQILIAEGDCPDSNWNQAAMQLAGYIAAKYTREQEAEFEELLVAPFIRNVSSSSRGSETARRKSFKYILSRALSGAIKFSPGGIIKTIGRRCGGCVVCESPAAPNTSLEGVVEGEFGFYDPATKIKITDGAVFRVTDDKDILLMRSGFKVSAYEMNYDIETQRETAHATTLHFSNGGSVCVEESSLADRRAFNQTASSQGEPFMGTEKDFQEMFTTLKKMRIGAEKMIRSERCGLILQEKDGNVFPHYVGRTKAFRKGSIPSEFMFTGSAHTAPEPDELPDIRSQEDANLMIETIVRLFNINNHMLMTQAIGWVCAANIKPFITQNGKRGFPLLNFAGSSHTGKSSTAYLLLALNGFPLRRVPIWNAEIDTPYPLEELVVTSTTVVRMIEEANEHTAGKNWDKLIGFLKGAWDEAGISRGAIRKKVIEVVSRKNTAPIMYLSEQPSTIQAIRTRSIECMFRPATLFKNEHKADYAFVEKNSKYLEMMGKVMISASLGVSHQKVDKWNAEAEKLLEGLYHGRTLQAYSAVIIGIKFLLDIVSYYSQEHADTIQDYLDAAVQEWRSNSSATSQRMARTALDDVVACFDQMAAEENSEMYGLVAGTHYWKNGDLIFLDVRSIFPRYRRFIRSQGFEGSIRAMSQLTELLAGELYYEGKIPHPQRDGLELHILNVEKLAAKSISLPYLQECPLDEG